MKLATVHCSLTTVFRGVSSTAKLSVSKTELGGSNPSAPARLSGMRPARSPARRNGSMATKATIVNGEGRQPPVKRQEKNPLSKFFDNVVGQWKEFSRFLIDVRAEMRKVVAPSW